VINVMVIVRPLSDIMLLRAQGITGCHTQQVRSPLALAHTTTILAPRHTVGMSQFTNTIDTVAVISWNMKDSVDESLDNGVWLCYIMISTSMVDGKLVSVAFL
jgi:hypothetical protein